MKAMDDTLTGTTASGSSEPWSNSNEEVPNTLQGTKTGTSPPDTVLRHTNETLFGV